MLVGVAMRVPEAHIIMIVPFEIFETIIMLCAPGTFPHVLVSSSRHSIKTDDLTKFFFLMDCPSRDEVNKLMHMQS